MNLHRRAVFFFSFFSFFFPDSVTLP